MALRIDGGPQVKRRRSNKGPDTDVSSIAAVQDAQENVEEDPLPDGQNGKDVGTTAVLSRIIEHHKCPITQQLLVDPVVAEDGHIYERKALELWLVTKKTSPTTNRAMGSSVVPALSARQTVNELVEEGMLDSDTLLAFYSDRGRLRSMRTSCPGPDFEGAKRDFERCIELAKKPTQRIVAEFHLEAVAWMRRGAGLFDQARRLQGTDMNGTSDPDMRSWMLDLGDAVRAAVTWPALKARRLSEWQDLPVGTRVRIVDDVSELQRLCERPPPEADAKVGWNGEMLGFAGKVCAVQRIGDTIHKNYILRREAPPSGRDFSFPYDALFLLSSV